LPFSGDNVLPYQSKSVGQELASVTTQVTDRLILAYAAGLDLCDARFLDDADEKNFFALPFYCASLEWAVTLSSRIALSTGLTDQEALRGVHAIQDSIFHRPIHSPGRLITKGRVVSVTQTRAGALVLVKYETLDAGNMAPVTTSWSSSIYRGVAVEGNSTVLEHSPALPLDPSAPLPQNHAQSAVLVPRNLPHIYSECANIWNPIHTERKVALAAGLPDIILHGTATWALAGLEISKAYLGGAANRLKRLHGRFVGMVIPGTSIIIRHAPAERGLVQFEVFNNEGGKVIDQGIALF
jgi:acyl dehydratase